MPSLRSLCLGLTLAASTASATPLRYAEDSAPGIINPLFTTNMTEARVQELIFDGLFTDGRDLQPTPRLLANYSVSEDRTQLTGELRSDVQWHDGNPLTADDVAFTIAAMKDPQTAST